MRQKSAGADRRRLDAQRSAHLGALLVAGAPIAVAAREVGIAPRTAHRWLRRAWSRESADKPFVKLAQTVVRGRIAALEANQPPWRAAPSPRVALEPFDEFLARVADLDRSAFDFD